MYPLSVSGKAKLRKLRYFSSFPISSYVSVCLAGWLYLSFSLFLYIGPMSPSLSLSLSISLSLSHSHTHTHTHTHTHLIMHHSPWRLYMDVSLRDCGSSNGKTIEKLPEGKSRGNARSKNALNHV